MVRRYAPDLFFGALEKWYLTDPRPYVVGTDDGSVVDRDGRLGAYRVTLGSFGDAGETVREGIRTGKVALARTLRDELDELYALAESLAESGEDTADEDRDADGDDNPILDRLSRARRAADAAVTAAENGEERDADDRLSNVVSLLADVREILVSDGRGGYDDAAVAAIDPKPLAGIDRANQAIDAATL